MNVFRYRVYVGIESGYFTTVFAQNATAAKRAAAKKYNTKKSKCTIISKSVFPVNI